MDQGPQHKVWFSDTAREEIRECAQFIVTGKDLLKGVSVAHGIRLTLHK